MDDVGDGGIDGDDATVDEVATLVLETNVTAVEVLDDTRLKKV